MLDIGLSATGHVGARRAARVLICCNPVTLFTSPLRRAQETSRIMSPILALTPQVRNGLRPWDVGTFAGQPVKAVAKELHAYSNGRADEAIPGGESFNTFLQRWKTELLALLGIMRKTDGPIIAVTHARNLYALKGIIFDEPIPVNGPPNPSAIVRLMGDLGQVTASTLFKGEHAEEFV